MNWKTLALAASAGTALLGAAPAFADPPGHARAHGWHAKQAHRAPSRPVVIYRPAPVYPLPAPVYYAPPVVHVPPPVIHVPPRVYYVEPRPVLYGQIPVSPHLGISFGLRL